MLKVLFPYEEWLLTSRSRVSFYFMNARLTVREHEYPAVLYCCTFHSRILISTVVIFDQRQYIYGLSFCRLVGKNDSYCKVIVTCEFRSNSTVGLSFVVPK